MRLFRLLALLCLALAPSLARADADAAAEEKKGAEDDAKVEGPANLDLDVRIKPVTGTLLLKARRHELSPTIQLSLNDAFFTKYVFGARYAYHFAETLSAGVNVGYAMSTPSGAVTRCDSKGGNCEVPTKEDLVRSPGDLGIMAGAEFSWAPLYGKISVLSESVLHFDTYLLAGGGVVQTKIAPAGSDEAAEAFAPEGHLAFGQRYFLTRSLVLRIEVRDLVYSLDVNGESDTQNQLMFSVGLSWFVGGGSES